MLGFGWLTVKVQAIYTYSHHFLFENNLPEAIIRIYIESEGTDAVYVSRTIKSGSPRWIEVNDVYESQRIPKATRISVEIMSDQTRVYVKQLKLTEFINTYYFEHDENDSPKINLTYFPIFIEEYKNPEYFEIIARGEHKQYQYEPCQIDSPLLNDYLSKSKH